MLISIINYIACHLIRDIITLLLLTIAFQNHKKFRRVVYKMYKYTYKFTQKYLNKKDIDLIIKLKSVFTVKSI